MTAMTVRRVLAVASVVFAMAPPAWAQPPDPPPAAGVPAPTRAAWFEHYQDTRKGPEATDTYTRTFKVGAGASLTSTLLPARSWSRAPLATRS